MSNIPSPKTPIVNVLLVGMDYRKESIFRMAFKMHARTQYNIVNLMPEESPDIAIVDVDGMDGMLVWKRFKEEYPDLPALLTSVSEPDFAVSFLLKPVKVEELFPILREALKGGAVFDPAKKKKEKNQEERIRAQRIESIQEKNSVRGGSVEQDEFVVRKFQRKEQLPTASIELFNINHGLLGTLRQVCNQERSVALVVDGRPILIVFPYMKRILLAVAPSDLEKLCTNDNIKIQIKSIGKREDWERNAKVSFDSCIWQFAIWTARGRLPSDIRPDTLLRLKSWPNLTRLAHLRDAVRLSAFMSQTTANLHVLYKILRVDLMDLLNFISATHAIGILDTKVMLSNRGKLNAQHGGVSLKDIRTQSKGNGLQEDEFMVRQKYKAQSTGMLQRLMRRLTGEK